MSSTFLFFVSGNHTIAVVKGPKDYGTLSGGLKSVIDAVNTLTEDGCMLIDGGRVNPHFHFGGDYKLCNPSFCYDKFSAYRSGYP